MLAEVTAGVPNENAISSHAKYKRIIHEKDSIYSISNKYPANSFAHVRVGQSYGGFTSRPYEPVDMNEI